jgi:Flp pilus assembly protein TadD
MANTTGEWFDKGNAYFLLGKNDEAIRDFDKAIEINKNDGEAWYGKGIGLQRLHRDSEAESALIKAKDLGCKF